MNEPCRCAVIVIIINHLAECRMSMARAHYDLFVFIKNRFEAHYVGIFRSYVERLNVNSGENIYRTPIKEVRVFIYENIHARTRIFFKKRFKPVELFCRKAVLNRRIIDLSKLVLCHENKQVSVFSYLIKIKLSVIALR